MRYARVLRSASDPFKYHTNDETAFMKKLRSALVVNPESSSGNPLPRANRTPEPGSRPEKMTVPASRASDVAQNQYFNRDFRRNYPKTEFVSQEELSLLLLQQGEGFKSLPPVGSSESATKALTANQPAPSLASLYSSSTAVAAKSFKPPTPPGRKFSWSPAKEVIPSDPNIDFPMTNFSAAEIKQQ
ncbi:hypothetical protein OIO90_001814 [Microbotryomycetes sp. JL221]|nr:hypothetical protein OIO90_001814 [Microbotryomycetes sp. JL221]